MGFLPLSAHCTFGALSKRTVEGKNSLKFKLINTPESSAGWFYLFKQIKLQKIRNYSIWWMFRFYLTAATFSSLQTSLFLNVNKLVFACSTDWNTNIMDAPLHQMEILCFVIIRLKHFVHSVWRHGRYSLSCTAASIWSTQTEVRLTRGCTLFSSFQCLRSVTCL